MLPLALGGPAHPGEHIRHDTFTWGGSSTPRAATGTWWSGPPQGTHLARHFYLGWLLVLPLVLGDPASPGEHI